MSPPPSASTRSVRDPRTMTAAELRQALCRLDGAARRAKLAEFFPAAAADSDAEGNAA